MTNYIQKNEYVLDTMGIVMRMEQRKLNIGLRNILNSAELGNTVIYIPSIVFAEIMYLSEKQKISVSIPQIADYMEKFPNYKEYPINFDVIKATSQILDIPELHDRIIAGTARLLNLHLITNDPVIQASKFVKTFW